MSEFTTQWAGSVRNHYGDPTYTLDTPLVTTDTKTGQLIEIKEIVDATENTYTGDNLGWFLVYGSKQKKDGSFYGNFSTLNAKIPSEVKDEIKKFNLSR